MCQMGQACCFSGVPQVSFAALCVKKVSLQTLTRWAQSITAALASCNSGSFSFGAWLPPWCPVAQHVIAQVCPAHHGTQSCRSCYWYLLIPGFQGDFPCVCKLAWYASVCVWNTCVQHVFAHMLHGIFFLPLCLKQSPLMHHRNCLYAKHT